MIERRRSPRYKINSDCNFCVLDKEENSAFYGNIENISEEGVCIRISAEIERDYVKDNLAIGNVIHFDAFNEVDADGNTVTDPFEADAEVLRIDEIGEEFSIGCHITNKTISFEDFVKQVILGKYLAHKL